MKTLVCTTYEAHISLQVLLVVLPSLQQVKYVMHEQINDKSVNDML